MCAVLKAQVPLREPPRIAGVLAGVDDVFFKKYIFALSSVFHSNKLSRATITVNYGGSYNTGGNLDLTQLSVSILFPTETFL